MSHLDSRADRWMELALREAEVAFKHDEVPVGAVIVKDGILIGRGHNNMQSLSDPTAHAEMIAITAACETINSGRLTGSDLYVTLEPCAMCAGAIVLARIKRLFYSVSDVKAGACGSVLDVIREPRLNHFVEVYSGSLETKSNELLTAFFKKLRTAEE